MPFTVYGFLSELFHSSIQNHFLDKFLHNLISDHLNYFNVRSDSATMQQYENHGRLSAVKTRCE